ncbi:MAG: polyphosphate polymerase domain-containing protein [Lachnospiraceae bacterium]|nr:polyphosphate polymerase domain-containing protein [Lachnospiraceae bacterium]
MRHELKYILTPVQYRVLKDRLKWFLKPDPHAGENGEYAIRSIYFDTDSLDAVWEKINGVDKRKKYRIRFYNGNADRCTLECKEKHGTRIHKISEPLTREEALALMQRESILPKRELSGQMALWVQKSQLHPVVTVDYVREAYIYPVSNVRVTFDKRLSAGRVEDAFSAPLGFPNVLGEQVILEVKYDEVLPLHISRLIADVQPVNMSVSKYVMCVEKRLAEKGF